MADEALPPILAGKHYNAPSAFTPESLLREGSHKLRCNVIYAIKGPPPRRRNSHGADALLTFACSDYEPLRPYKPIEADLAWVV